MLGWDNHDKIAGFRAEQDDVQGRLKVVAGQLDRINQQLGALGRHNQQLGVLGSVTEFGEISWQATARSIEDLKAEKRALETTSDVLQQLMAKQKQLTAKLERMEDKAGKLRERLGANEKDARDIADAIEECRAILGETPVTDDAGVLAAVGRLAEATLGDKPLTYRNTRTIQWGQLANLHMMEPGGTAMTSSPATAGRRTSPNASPGTAPAPARSRRSGCWTGGTATPPRAAASPRAWVDAKVRNAVVLTGDVHRNWANDVKMDYKDPASPVVGSELVCRSISSTGNGTGSTTDPVQAWNPHLKFYIDNRGYVNTKITRDAMTADFRVLD